MPVALTPPPADVDVDAVLETAPAPSGGARVVRAANWVQRTIAAAVDLGVCALLTLGFGVVAYLDLPPRTHNAGPPLHGVDRLLDVTSRFSTVIATMLVASAAAMVIYQTLTVAVMGRTLGQKAVGVRLLSRNGRRPGPVAATVRGLVSGVGLVLLGAGWLWSLFDGRRSGWHDRAVRLDLVQEPAEQPTPPSVEGEPHWDDNQELMPPAADEDVVDDVVDDPPEPAP